MEAIPFEKNEKKEKNWLLVRIIANYPALVILASFLFFLSISICMKKLFIVYYSIIKIDLFF